MATAQDIYAQSSIALLFKRANTEKTKANRTIKTSLDCTKFVSYAPVTHHAPVDHPKPHS